MNDTSGENFHWQHSDQYIVDCFSRDLKDKVGNYYDDLTSQGVNVTGKPWGGQDTARTFRFEIRPTESSIAHVVFIKLCPIFPSMNPALLEYETLQILYDKMPLVQDNCYVSRPLDYYPKFNAYSMESVGTRNFKPYLLQKNSRLRSTPALSDLFSIVSGSARWLSAFHEITRSKKVVQFNHKTILDGINEDFDFFSMRKFHFRKDTIRQLDQVMQNIASLDSKFDLPCAKWHWDFTPGHVYLDNNRISVIDILGIDDIPIFEDIGRFLASMTAINNFPFYPFYDFRRAEGALCDRFLETYAANTQYDRQWFLLFTHIYTLKYLIIWFFSQHQRVGRKVNPFVATVFANLKLVPFYERPLMNTLSKINQKLGSISC
jgi:hypothetical protein